VRVARSWRAPVIEPNLAPLMTVRPPMFVFVSLRAPSSLTTSMVLMLAVKTDVANCATSSPDASPVRLSPMKLSASCAESAVTIVAFVASLRSATSATRRTASAWHALTAVAMPGGGCGSRMTPVGRVASSDGASPINHMPMCAPEGVTPTAASFAVSSATSAICSEVSAASASRSAANTPPASG